MTITYSCIANGRVILAELALTGGSYQEAASSVLKLVLLKAEKKTTARIGSYVYHTLLIDGITYLCATDNPLDNALPSAFLEEVSKTYSENPLLFQEPFPLSNAVIADFQHVLGNCMVKRKKGQKSKMCMMKYNQYQSEFKISALKSQVSDVKNSMTQNIDKMLRKEEKLNVLIDKTDNLQIATKSFQKTTTKMSKKMWWRNYKIIIIIFSILIIIIIILLSTNVIPV
ncbi:vesicle-associated membrane protein 712-like [Gracilinanus agilis]|uniref:vesicle-associated membrane protein 712-like n=1 Tax=Gracilinanus agilis TaxID=191870 RepID=UPI001CFF0EDD|nr:vesicle-associated membrane protein 712-like [Gracilinanus agilis]